MRSIDIDWDKRTLKFESKEIDILWNDDNHKEMQKGFLWDRRRSQFCRNV